MCAYPVPRSRVVLSIVALASLMAIAPLHAQNESPVRIDLGGGQTLELVHILPGTFTQGSPTSEAGRGNDETPHKVTLTKPFLLGKYPVTRGQFERFVTETHYRTEAESGPSGGFGWNGTQLTQRKEFTWRAPGFPQTNEHPVTLVTYRDAGAFLQWLSRKSGRTFTLPSEAQWEYAARGGTTANPAADLIAWHKGNAANGTHPVGQKALNAWGLGDMMGNVWEWCEDWYAPYAAGDATDPLQRNSNLSDKPRRVLRGGSWLREAKFSRPATRYRNDAASRNADNGFRVMTFDTSTAVAPPPAVAVAQTTPVRTQSSSIASAPSTPVYAESGRIRITTPQPAAANNFHFDSASKSASSSFSFMGILITLVFFGILIFIIRAIVRAISGNMGGSGSAGNFRYMPGQPLRVRVVDDGFWVVAEGIAIGTTLFCRYEANGQAQQSQISYQGGPQGQFVFTGGRPSNVSVSASSGSSSFEPMTGGTMMSTPPRHFVDTDPPFRGHPSAY